MSLAGKTLFITGASRGIGLAIALRAARDGANIVVAAKTADPHPKLPGTIHTAAEAIRAAGGQALPLVVDVRDEASVMDAVAQTVAKFGGIDIKLEVYIQTPKMREENAEPFLLSRSNMKDLYWTIGQMLTHHASNGCNLQTGDLIATGTVSGKEKDERGCLLELTWRGKEPIQLPNGEERRFLEDGDEIIMKGFCEREGFKRIGFGECRGRILPAD